VVQPRNLGWQANINFLMGQVDTPYQAIIPHDDTLPRDYISALTRRLADSPRAVLAFGPMDRFGDLEGETPDSAPITGPVPQRLATFLRRFRAGPVRGVVARQRLPQPVPFPQRWRGDILYLIDLLACGEFEFVPSVRYRKRMHAASVTGSLRQDSRGWQADWVGNAEDCALHALRAVSFPADVALIRGAALDRLLARRTAWETPGWLAHLRPGERDEMVRGFARTIGWDEVEALRTAGPHPGRRPPWRRALHGLEKRLPGRGPATTD
jgi:hypothetical protein